MAERRGNTDATACDSSTPAACAGRPNTSGELTELPQCDAGVRELSRLFAIPDDGEWVSSGDRSGFASPTQGKNRMP
jgi:hypothetical protein